MLTLKKTSLFDLFENISSVSSRNAKLAMLEKATEDQQWLMETAFNPYKQFHITKWRETYRSFTEKFGSDDKALDSFKELIQTCINLNRSSELENLVASFFQCCSDKQKEWFGRVIRKDLRIGVTTKSINKVFSNLIPVMEVMLANKAEKDFSNVDFNRPKISERKYDGFRVLAFYREKGIVDGVGRSGKEIENREFYEHLRQSADSLTGCVLDGEGYCHSLSFEEFSGKMRREDAKLPDDFGYYIFDVLTLEEWDTRQTALLATRLERRIEVAETNDFFHAVPFDYVDFETKQGSIDKIKELYNLYIEQGYEGAMLKYLDAPYEWKRSSTMLKVKPEDFVDMRIKDCYEGQGKYVGMLGGFICESLDENSGKQDVRVGGGYKDWERKEFWDKIDSLLGTVVEVKFTEGTTGGSLRHPNFRRLRKDR
jgi:DNA ligase-1